MKPIIGHLEGYFNFVHVQSLLSLGLVELGASVWKSTIRQKNSGRAIFAARHFVNKEVFAYYCGTMVSRGFTVILTVPKFIGNGLCICRMQTSINGKYCWNTKPKTSMFINMKHILSHIRFVSRDSLTTQGIFR